jgi:hypothetical protein
MPIQQRPAGNRILDSSKLADVFGLDLAPVEVEMPAGGKGVGRLTRKVSRKVAKGTAAAGKKKKSGTARRKGRV